MARNHMLRVDVRQLRFLFFANRLGLCASWMEAARASLGAVARILRSIALRGKS